jgi:hypothetical protein
MPESFRSGQEKLGVKALHVVPIFVENKCWGVVGFDDCREVKHRGQSELSVLKIAADSIGSAIQRDRSQQGLLRTEKEQKTELERINQELQQRDRILEAVAIAIICCRFLRIWRSYLWRGRCLGMEWHLADGDLVEWRCGVVVVLGRDTLESGTSTRILFEGNASTCRYDIREEFNDGDVVEDYKINLCNTNSYSFTQGR